MEKPGKIGRQRVAKGSATNGGGEEEEARRGLDIVRVARTVENAGVESPEATPKLDIVRVRKPDHMVAQNDDSDSDGGHVECPEARASRRVTYGAPVGSATAAKKSDSAYMVAPIAAGPEPIPASIRDTVAEVWQDLAMPQNQDVPTSEKNLENNGGNPENATSSNLAPRSEMQLVPTAPDAEFQVPV